MNSPIRIICDPSRVVSAIMLVIFVFLLCALYFGEAQHKRLMQECMADGHKEYECAGILRGKVTIVQALENGKE